MPVLTLHRSSLLYFSPVFCQKPSPDQSLVSVPPIERARIIRKQVHAADPISFQGPRAILVIRETFGLVVKHQGVDTEKARRVELGIKMGESLVRKKGKQIGKLMRR